jgi:hypothetical protein
MYLRDRIMNIRLIMVIMGPTTDRMAAVVARDIANHPDWIRRSKRKIRTL